MVMLWLTMAALAQEEPTTPATPTSSEDEAGESAESAVLAEQASSSNSETPEEVDDTPSPTVRGEDVLREVLEDADEELTEEQVDMLEQLIEGMLTGTLQDLEMEVESGSVNGLQSSAPEPDDGFDDPLVPDEEWLLEELPEDWHEPMFDDPLYRQVPLWFGIEIGTMTGVRAEVSRPEWRVEGALRLGAYTRIDDAAALQPTAVAALEFGRGIQLVGGGGVTLRDGEIVPVVSVGLQRDRRETPAHLQSGLLFEPGGWRGLDTSICWLW